MFTTRLSLHRRRRLPLAALTAFGLAAALTLAAPGHAQTPAPAPAAPAPTTAPAPDAPALGLTQLLQRLAQQGYSDITEVEREGDRLWEVKARNSAGQRVKLKVDGRSAEVLRERRER